MRRLSSFSGAGGGFLLLPWPNIRCGRLQWREGDVVSEDFEAGRVVGWTALREGAGDFTFGEQACAFHDVDGVGVEFAGDASFGLGFAEAEHAEALDEDDGGVGVAEGGRVGRGEGVVVVGVLLAVFVERGDDLLAEGEQVGAFWPRDEERANLGANEMVGATGAEKGKIFCVNGVDELEDVGAQEKLEIQRFWC